MAFYKVNGQTAFWPDGQTPPWAAGTYQQTADPNAPGVTDAYLKSDAYKAQAGVGTLGGGQTATKPSTNTYPQPRTIGVNLNPNESPERVAAYNNYWGGVDLSNPMAVQAKMTAALGGNGNAANNSAWAQSMYNTGKSSTADLLKAPGAWQYGKGPDGTMRLNGGVNGGGTPLRNYAGMDNAFNGRGRTPGFSQGYQNALDWGSSNNRLGAMGQQMQTYGQWQYPQTYGQRQSITRSPMDWAGRQPMYGNSGGYRGNWQNPDWNNKFIRPGSGYGEVDPGYGDINPLWQQQQDAIGRGENTTFINWDKYKPDPSQQKFRGREAYAGGWNRWQQPTPQNSW